MFPRFQEIKLYPAFDTIKKEKSFTYQVLLFDYVIHFQFIYGEGGNIKFKTFTEGDDKKMIVAEVCFNLFFHSLAEVNKEVCLVSAQLIKYVVSQTKEKEKYSSKIENLKKAFCEFQNNFDRNNNDCRDVKELTLINSSPSVSNLEGEIGELLDGLPVHYLEVLQGGYHKAGFFLHTEKDENYLPSLVKQKKVIVEVL